MARERKSFVLAIDIGSSSTRAALFDARGAPVRGSAASVQYAIRYTPDGGAELDAPVLLNAARSCIGKALRAGVKGHVAAVAGSAFWHSLLGLDRTGTPLTPVFTWADSRSAPDAAELRAQLSEREIQLRTGCMMRAPFWPAKLRWLKRTRPALFRRVARWVSPAAWIFEELFGTCETSHSMASGTGLYNLRHRSWDEKLCALCGVAVEKLGALGAISRATKKLADANVFTAIGDGAASNLGCAADGAGKIAINIGTSAAVRVVLPNGHMRPRQLPRGLFRYVVDDGRMLIGGAVSNAGNLRRWCLRELRVRDDAAGARAAAAEDALTILPFWVAERAPTWPEDLRGAISGITAATSAADILRATQTSVFYRLAAVLEELETATGRATEVIVSGGILQSPASLAILADCLGRDVRVSGERESSSRGAASYALEQLGFNLPAPRARLLKHQPALAAKHRARRERQEALERASLKRRRG